MYKPVWIHGRKKKKHLKRRKMTEFFKVTQSKTRIGVAEWPVEEALGSFILLHCCNFLCSIPAVGHNCAWRLRSRVRELGLSERKKMKGGKTACNTPLLLLPSPLPLPSHQRPPSINLCQLLPRAKPCLRETDLKGPIKGAAPLWGYSATTDSGWGCKCSGQSSVRVRDTNSTVPKGARSISR